MAQTNISLFNQLLTPLIGLLGVLIGFILKAIYDYFQSKKDRYDKYYFVLLEKRFKVYQEANYECEKLKTVVHKDNDEKWTVVQEARTWFYKHNLYISPDLRDDFFKLILDVSFYGDTLQEFRFTVQDKGSKSPEAEEVRKDLNEKWNNIMVAAQRKLHRDIDKYYEILNRWSNLKKLVNYFKQKYNNIFRNKKK